jgi:hypothetical protein
VIWKLWRFARRAFVSLIPVRSEKEEVRSEK